MDTITILLDITPGGIIYNGGTDYKSRNEKELEERIGTSATMATWCELMRLVDLKIKELDSDLRFSHKRGDYFSEDYRDLRLMRFYAEKARLLASLKIQEYKNTTDLTVFGV